MSDRIGGGVNRQDLNADDAGRVAEGAAILRRIKVVLCRPRYGGNVGSAARAVKNMGLGGLVLAAPEDYSQSEARMMAASAADILSGARVVPRLEDALSGFGVVMGASRRVRSGRARIMDPREAAALLLSAMGDKEAAVLFGPEDSGLTAAELSRCSAVISIPSEESCPSLNLAQSVMVVAYELRMTAGLGGGAVRSFGTASAAEGEGMLRQVESVLAQSGFFLRNPRGRVMLHLRGILSAGVASSQDARIVRGIFRRVAWALNQDRKNRKGGRET